MASKNIFELIPSSFFAPLSSRDKRLNFELLNILNEKMQDDISQFSRDQVLSWLEEYLSHTNFEVTLNDDEDTDGDEVKTPHSMALYKLNYFEKCGWLSQETDNDFKVTYQMTSPAIDQLKLFSDMINEDQRPLELTSFVYSIYSDLRNEDWNHSVDRMENIERNVINLTTLLRGLNSKVRKFLSKLLENPAAEPSKILDALLVDYRNSVVLKGFSNLRSKDNPSKYKAEILQSIDNLKGHMFEMVNNYLEIKCDNRDTQENRLAASDFFLNVLRKVEDFFSSVDDMINKINQKNSQYVSATHARLAYLLNEERDLEGRINSLFKEMQATEYDGEESFHLYKMGLIDDTSSLFQPRKSKTKVKYQMPLKNKEFDKQLIELNKKRLQKQMMFSIPAIKRFVMSYLKDKKSITAKEIEINGFDQLMRIFLVEIYSTSPIVQYKIKIRDESINWHGYSINDFVIERREQNGSSK